MDTPSSRVSLSFCCRGLPKLDLLSNSDPMVVVFSQRPHVNSQWFEVGRTEMIRDCHDPDFTTHINMDYFFEEMQPLRFTVVDVDDPKTRDLNPQDMIGTFETRLTTLATARNQEVTGQLTHKNKQRGTITARLEELSDVNHIVHLHLAGVKLDRKDGFLGFGKSDPFIRIYRAREGGAWEAVHETEVIKQDLNPVWKAFTIPIGKLCNGDHYRPLRFECHDWDSDGSTDFIGSYQTSLNDLLAGNGGQQLINDKKKKNGGVAGSIKVLRAELEKFHSILEYVMGGCELSLITAIDFTASNGNPREGSSLHHISAAGPTEYEKALLAIGNIIVPYDTDGMVPTFGFGARLQGGQVSHCFPLVPDGCHGVSGVLNAYRNTVHNVTLYGPTIFEQVIRTAAAEAQAAEVSQSNQKYVVLLILTDGVITDMENTIGAIVDASSLPLAIIIVGVGNANFDDMNRLDADDHPLSSRGRTATRDIVQFVPFNQFVNQPHEALAKATLAELPTQLTSFMKANNIVPNAPNQKMDLYPDTATAPSAPPPDAFQL